MKRKRLIGLFLLLTLSLITAVSSFAQSDVAEILITNVDGSEDTFPEIRVRFRVLDSIGDFVSDLTAETLSMAEGNETVTFTNAPVVREDGNLWVHFVINGGSRMQGVILNNVYNSIETFIDDPDLHLDGDQIALSLTEQDDLSTRQQFTGEMTLFENMRETAIPCSNGELCARPFSTTDDLVDGDAWEEAGNNPRILIYLTGLIDDERDENGVLAGSTMIESWGREAARNNITIYTIVFDQTLSDNKLADLAEASGGMAVSYGDLDTLYETIINRHRPYYAASYRTTNPNSGPRPIVVTYNGDTDDIEDDISDVSTYEVTDLPPPGVTIDNPEANFAWESAEAVEVKGEILFINYNKRLLDYVALSVNGEEQERIESPVDTGFTFRLTRDMLADTADTEVTLTVTAVDELGFSEEKTISIIANPLPADAVPAPEPTSVATAEPDNSSTAIQSETAFNSDTVLLFGLIILAGAMIYLVVANRRKAPIQNFRNTIQTNIERVTKRYRQQTEVKGYLIVLQGDNNMGKALEIYGTTRIGRSKEDADLLFQQHDDHSPISRLHCTILDEEDHFKLRDEDSANGTYLNGVRLPAMSPRELYDGDEIELARVERGGVKIKFQSVQQQEEDLPHTVTERYGSRQEPLASDDKRNTRVAPKPNRQPNFGQDSGDRF